MIFVTVKVNISKMPFWKFLNISCFQSSQQLEAHWQQHLKDTLLLKTVWTWVNIRVNSFLDKYDETKMGEGALKIISCTKIRACSLKNIAPRHFTYHYILLFLWNKPSFQIQPSGDWKIFSTTCLPFYLLILCILEVIQCL